MKDQIYYRQWCKSCNDFTIHERIYSDEKREEKYLDLSFNTEQDFVSVCQCGCQYTPVNLQDVPEEKIVEQRLRFKEKRKRDFQETMSMYGHSLKISDLITSFSTPGINSARIVESDAGLKKEEEEDKLKKARVKQEQKDELYKFKNVGRNDTCLCGSNKKYKKCCSLIHDTY